MTKLRRRAGVKSGVNYQVLEPRKVLAPLFPIYVNGELSLGDPDSAAPYPLDQTFALETNPDATKTIYLDYDGFRSVNNRWNHDIDFPAFSLDGDTENFSDAELIQIQLQLQTVAEDFAPFDINVTTRFPGIEALRRTGAADQTWGIRVVNTQPTDGFGEDFGGVAFLNSFNDSEDTPAFTVQGGVNVGALTNSHEVGHSLGLLHDGLGDIPTHPGAGTGQFSWGPLLGAPFNANITQWSNGDYANSTNSQDDFQVITSRANGVEFRTDEAGNNPSSAADLPSEDGGVSTFGFIADRNDLDYYEFSTSGGNVTFTAEVFQGSPNLDVELQIVDSNGQTVAINSPVNSLNASISTFLTEGTYFLVVDGVGREGSYSDYGSVGFYTLEGQFPPAEEPSAVVGESGIVTNVFHQFTTIQFDQTYENPVVIAGLPTRNGGDPVTVRVRNVTSNSAEIALQEWLGQDGLHGFETVSYAVFEAGEHTLADGTRILAGVAGGQNHRFRPHSFGNTFSRSQEVPVVLAQTVTNNEASTVAARIRGLNRRGFSLRLAEANADNRIHANEQVAWVAIEQGIGRNGQNRFIADATALAVTHQNFRINYGPPFSSTPNLFALAQTHRGGDPFQIRLRNANRFGATVFLEEEQSGDLEITHNPERVGYLAISNGMLEPAAISRAASFSASANQLPDGAALRKTGRLVDGDLSKAFAEMNSYVFQPKGLEADGALLAGLGGGDKGVASSTDATRMVDFRAQQTSSTTANVAARDVAGPQGPQSLQAAVEARDVSGLAGSIDYVFAGIDLDFEVQDSQKDLKNLGDIYDDKTEDLISIDLL